MSVLTWNGTASDTLGVTVEKLADKPIPARRYTTVSVPGRNGDILVPDGSYSNMSVSYQLHLSAEASGLASIAHDVAEWLAGPEGYAKLVDDADPGYYLEAAFMGPSNISNLLKKHGQATVTFSCKPCYFLNVAASVYNVTPPQYIFSITNTTNHIARPFISIEDAYGAKIRIVGGGNDQTVSITSGSSSYPTVFDCERREVYIDSGDGDPLYLQYTLTYDDFPCLMPGVNTITLTNSDPSVWTIDWRRWVL